MKIAVGLFILIGICCSQTAARIGFYPQKEYRYEYVGQVLTGLPNVADDRAAVGITAGVVIQTESNNLLVKLENVRTYAGQFSGKSKPNEEAPMDYQSTSQQELNLPFRVLYRGNSDEFQGVETSSSDPSWSVNIKKALATFLQVRLDQQLSKRQGYFADIKPTGSFEPIDIVEVGVEGKCPTKYIYASTPSKLKPFARVLNVTKFRDTANCKERPVWKRTITEPLKCAGCDPAKETFINHGSVSYYDLYEESGQYVLQEAHSYGQGDIKPFPPKGDVLRITQYQRLNLKGISGASNRISISGQVNHHTIMGISPETITEVPNRGPRYRRQTKTGSYTKTSPFKKQPIKQEDNKEFIRKIIDAMTVGNITDDNLHQLTKGVDIVRKLTYEEIQELYNSIDSDDNKRWQNSDECHGHGNDRISGSLLYCRRIIYLEKRGLECEATTTAVNFIVTAGTDAAILFIKNLVEQGKITGEFAVEVISNIAAYVLDPKPSLLEEIWGLCKGKVVKQNRQIYVTSLLAFGELVNQACVPKEEPKTIIPFQVKTTGCPTSLTTRYLQEVTRMFDQTPEIWEKVAIALSMMRMGLNNTIDYIAPLLQDKYFGYIPSIRAAVLMTLYETGPGRENDVVKYLMPIFYNDSLSIEERLIAMDILAYTTTSQQIMNQIALSTWEMKNTQLHAYISNYLEKVAQLTHSCWSAMALRSRQALPLIAPIKSGILDSSYSFSGSYEEQYGLGSIFGYGLSFSPRSAIPSTGFTHIANQIGGYYYSTFEMAFFSDGLQKVVDYMTGPQSYYPHDRKFSNLFKDEPDTQTKSKYEYKHDDLNIKPRGYKPLNAYFYISYLGSRHRLFFLDSHTLDDIKQSGLIPSNKDLYSAVRDGIPINYNQFALFEDSQVKFTSVIGIPIKVEFKVPVYMKMEGKISVEAAKTGITNSLSSISIKPDIENKYAFKAWLGVEAEVPFAHKNVGAYASTKMYYDISLHGYFNADLTQRSIAAGLRQPKTKSVNKHVEETIYKFETDPFIIVRDTQTNEKTLYPIRDKQLSPNVVEVMIPGLFGNSMKISETWNMKPGEKTEYQNEQKHKNLLHRQMFWWAPQKFNYRSVSFSQQPVDTDTNQIELKINWKPSPTPFEDELWRGKSVLEKIRLWNLIPEWTGLPLQCDAIDDSIPYKATATEPPAKKGWFSRFKDKVKSTFGRSGGSDDSDEDDHDDDDDRGRALHPHLVTGSPTTGDSSSGSRSSLTGYDDHSSHSSQSRSAQQPGYYGQTTGGHDYGQTSSGQHYGQTTDGQHYGQTTGGQDYGQTSYGGGDVDDFSQQSSKGHGGYAPGTGPGHTTYPYRPQTADQVSVPKKTVVKVLNLKDEISTMLIAVQLNALGPIKMKIEADSTLTYNIPQGTAKHTIDIDASLGPIEHYKVCYVSNGYNMNTKCPGRLNRDGVVFDSHIQWGLSCDNTNFVSAKTTLLLNDQDNEKFEQLKRKCNVQRYSYVSDECIKEYSKTILFNKEIHDMKYSKNVPNMFQGLVRAWEKEYCRMNDYVTESETGNFVEEGRLLMEKRFHCNGTLLDIEMKLPNAKKVFKNIDSTMFGPHMFPLSPYRSFVYQFLQRHTKGKFTEVCHYNAMDGKVTTFNGVKYTCTGNNCEHVLVKDCSPSQLFTVTTSGSDITPKHLGNFTFHILDHKIRLDSSTFGRPGAGLTFEVDGKKHTITKGQSAVIRSQGYDDYFLTTVSPFGSQAVIKSPLMGFGIVISSTSITITLSQSWKGKICGLCGETTGEPEQTFLGPDQCNSYSDTNSFIRSYQVTSQKCPIKDQSIQSPCQPPSGYTRPYLTRPAGAGGGGSGYGGSVYPGGYSSGRRTGEGYEPYGGGGSYDEEPGQYGQQTGTQPFGQLAKSTDDYATEVVQPDTSTVYEEPFVTATRTPVGGNDEGSCVVRRNFLKRMVESVKGTRVKKLCFSTHAIRQCRRTCAGVNLTPQTVQFICYKEPHTQAEKWANEVNDRALTDLVSEDYDFEEEIMVAQDCHPQY